MAKSKIIGIYCIQSLATGKKYIGQAVDINRRWIRHRSAMKNNRHENYLIQKEYASYGKDNFKFFIIQECAKEVLSLLEVYWIAYHNAFVDDGGFNLTRGGEEVLALAQSTKDKISASLKKETNAWRGQHHTEEGRKNICAGITKLTEEQKLENTFRQVGTKKSKSTYTKYVGIRKKIANGKEYWEAQIKYRRQTFYLGAFSTEIDAAIAYNIKSSEIYKEKARLNNIPENVFENRIDEVIRIMKETEIRHQKRQEMQHGNIIFDKRLNKWKLMFKYDKKLTYLGMFPTIAEAKIQYNISAKDYYADKAVLLNISQEEIDIMQTDNTLEKVKEKRIMSDETKSKLSMSRFGKKTGNNLTSKYCGVYYDPVSKKWSARLRYNHKNIYLGYFPTELEAALYWNETMELYYGWKVKDKLNIIPQSEIDKLWEMEIE